MRDRVNRAGAGHVLEGFSVVNLGINIPGPVAAARLAEVGASVTKIEPPDGDPLESASPEWYVHLTRGQRVVRLDLKDEGGRAELDRLLAGSDLILTSSRPSALARLGLAWPSLEARFPHLLQIAIVGHNDPRQELPGHDLTYVAALGLISPPALPRTLVADLGGAERAVSTALALLLSRERGGTQRYAEVALSDSAAFFAAPWAYGLTRADGLLGGSFPFYRLYEADGGWVALGALERRFQRLLSSELGLPSADAGMLEAAFQSRTPAEWQAWAEQTGVPLVALDDGRGAGGSDGLPGPAV